MAIKTSVAGRLVVLSLALAPLPAFAQTAATELDVTVGRSTEDVHAASSQLRVFGDAFGGWVYYLEAAWGQQWGEESDAFGSAYPYDKRLRPAEMYAERTILKGPYLAGVRVGQFRTPFGISGRSDQAYNGFSRAPLIRYGEYWALSNNYLEDGVSIVAGTPRLFAEGSVGLSQDQDEYKRRQGIDSTLRVQGTIGPVIVGVSHIHTQPAASRTFALGSSVFTGVDGRWMHGGVQLRGEWVDGHPFGGTRTFGGYLDVLVHRPVMGPVTAVFRAERLDYEAGRFSSYPRRYSAGARVRLSNVLVGQVNVVHQPVARRFEAFSGVDVSLTFTTRR